MNSIEKVFYDTLKEETELNGPYLVAFSGGCDSLALLILCSRNLPKGSVFPVYVNHRIRKDAELESEIELNCMNCDVLHLPLDIADLGEDTVFEYAEENKCGVEAAARILRYGILERKRKEYSCNWILTAHHLDDQIETVAMKIMTNAPIPSLRGIAPTIGRIARPLIKIRKQNIRNYVVECGFSWSEDSTNRDCKYLRNFVRNVYIPEKISEDSEFEEKILKAREDALSQCSCEVKNDGLSIDKNVYLSLDSGGRDMMLFSIWDSCFAHFRCMPQTLTHRITESCLSGKDGIIEANGARFEIYRGKIYISDISDDEKYFSFDTVIDVSHESTTDMPGKMRLIVSRDEMSYDINPGVLYLCKSSFSGDVHLRFAGIGDCINLKGGKKMVLRMLQDMKIPASLRKRVPLIYDNIGICAVFCSVYGGRDRISSRMYHSLAENDEYKYYIQIPNNRMA